jgi:hypothetical protein
MCTHSFTTEYDPAPNVFPVLYLHGCTWACADRGCGEAIVGAQKRERGGRGGPEFERAGPKGYASVPGWKNEIRRDGIEMYVVWRLSNDC